MELRDILKKVVLLGDGAVGKTSLVARYVVNKFDDKYIATIGTKVSRKDIQVIKPNLIINLRMMIWDILGQKEYSKIRSVGSTPIAKYVYETGTRHGKRVKALGGAKNHMVALPDADIDMAADAAVSAAYGSAGERCMAVSVVVAVDGVGDELVAAIKERVPKVKVGDGMEPSSEMGPLVTAQHRDKVASYIDSGRAQGASVVADGRESAPPGDGFFLGVSLLDDVTPAMDAYRDEIFGPVLSVVRVDTYDEALSIAGGGRLHVICRETRTQAAHPVSDADAKAGKPDVTRDGSQVQRSMDHLSPVDARSIARMKRRDG